MPLQTADLLARNTLSAAIGVLTRAKNLAERAISQLDDDQLFMSIDSEANSIAIIVKHLNGNMRSRWSDFLSTDGEKPTRQRDNEFVIAPEERRRDVVMNWWNDGWSHVFITLNTLTADDLNATVSIRTETMPAVAAIFRSIDHYAQHVGQIVQLAKHLRGKDWETLSIPRGKSVEFEARFRSELAAKRS
jgi:hypothetical protein